MTEKADIKIYRGTYKECMAQRTIDRKVYLAYDTHQIFIGNRAGAKVEYGGSAILKPIAEKYFREANEEIIRKVEEIITENVFTDEFLNKIDEYLNSEDFNYKLDLVVKDKVNEEIIKFNENLLKNYYDKNDISEKLKPYITETELEAAISKENLDQIRNDIKSLKENGVDINLGDYFNKNEVITEIETRLENINLEDYVKNDDFLGVKNSIKDIQDDLSNKQDKLKAGLNITIDENGVISSKSGNDFKIVSVLPVDPSSSTTYLILDEKGKYTRWAWIDGQWANLGNMDMELDNFYNINDIDNMLKGYAEKNDINNVNGRIDTISESLDDYVKKEALPDNIITSDEIDDIIDDSVSFDLAVPNPTVSIGGIGKDYKLAGKNVLTVLNDILHPYVKFTASLSISPKDGGYLEVGATQTIQSATISINLGSDSIQYIKLYKVDSKNERSVIGKIEDPSKISTRNVIDFEDINIETNTRFEAEINDGVNTITASKSFSFIKPYYFGTFDSTNTTMGKKLVGKGDQSFTIEMKNSKAFIAYPVEYGELSKIMDSNNFDVIDTFELQIIKNEKDEETYYAYTMSVPATAVMTFTCRY